MSSPEILIKEQCGALGKINHYTSVSGQSNKVYKLTKGSEPFPKFIVNYIISLLKDIFLPYGYPDSVSKDYFDYQIWDTIQAFCSTISGTFTTQAVLKGVGVGNAEATPLAAAITWIAKDGTGMIGRIIFAWIKGSSLDSNCKKWRLVADFLNDGAMFLELLIPYCKNFAIHLLCMTTSMKAIVGVAGGATRASITQHQAIKGNMADVSAKDGSQETFVNLIASVIGVFLLTVVNDAQYQWGLFLIFTLIHLLANYYAVTSLVFTNLNNTRLVLVLKTYLKFGGVSNPINLSKKEPVLLGIEPKIRDLCSFDIKLGTSLKHLPHIASANEVKLLTEMYKNKNYLLVPDLHKRTVYIAIVKDETAADVLTAYFHAVMLAITLCLYNKIPMNISTKRQLHHVTPVVRLTNAMRNFSKNESDHITQMPLQMLQCLDEFIKQEVTMFFTALKVNGWSLETHSLEVGEWRCAWADRQNDKKYE